MRVRHHEDQEHRPIDARNEKCVGKGIAIDSYSSLHDLCREEESGFETFGPKFTPVTPESEKELIRLPGAQEEGYEIRNTAGTSYGGDGGSLHRQI